MCFIASRDFRRIKLIALPLITNILTMLYTLRQCCTSFYILLSATLGILILFNATLDLHRYNLFPWQILVQNNNLKVIIEK